MNEKYNQPTAHMLQPTKGWESMAHLDFTACIDASVENAVAGTVMHLNNNGYLETGLLPQGMGMFLFYKQNDEDTLNYPTTEDGTRITSISMNSFGGYNSERYLRGEMRDSEGAAVDIRDGGASNFPGYRSYAASAVGDTAPSYSYTPAKSAHLTYPAICGMELASTEFAVKKYDTSETSGFTSALGDYKPNVCLTSPVKEPNPVTGTYGTVAQQHQGGFLKPAIPYAEPVCGIVSRGWEENQHGYPQVYFWATWLPALSAGDLTAGTLTYTAASGDTPASINWAS